MDILDGVQKETELLYLHDIVLKVEKFEIPSVLVVNIDQTPRKYVPVGNKSMAAKGEHSVIIQGIADKRSVNETFSISFDGNFLLVQIIYGGKTTQSVPRFEFLKDFIFSTNLFSFSTIFFKHELIAYVLEKSSSFI